MNYRKYAGLSLLVFGASSALALESTAMLPEGIRRLQIKTVNTTIDEKTNSTGVGLDVADPLQKSVAFKDIIKKENALRQEQIRSTLNTFGYGEEEVVGEMNAEMQGKVSVVAPVFAYGITDKFTLAIAVPYYTAEMDVALGFETTSTAQAFLNDISQPGVNQVKSARDAGDKLNNAVGNLNDDLTENGFDTLEKWEGSGIGDITLAAKNMMFKGEVFKVASLSGVVLPTGKVDDPDNLIDIPFGDGTYDVFYTAIFDQDVNRLVKFNQYAKYTHQIISEREMRLATEDESIEVGKDDVRYKLGDKVEGGISVQYANYRDGFEAALGAVHEIQYGDRYYVEDELVKEKLQLDSDSAGTFAEARVGFSSIPGFRRKQIPVPFKVEVGYKRHLQSRNLYTNDLVTFDLSLFF